MAKTLRESATQKESRITKGNLSKDHAHSLLAAADFLMLKKLQTDVKEILTALVYNGSTLVALFSAIAKNPLFFITLKNSVQVIPKWDDKVACRAVTKKSFLRIN